MKTENRKKQAKPSATKLTRWFALYLCGPELAGFQQPPVSFLNSACEWFLQSTDKLRGAGSKISIVLHQVAIAYPTDPGQWGSKLLKRALGKRSLGPLYFVDRDGIRRCEPYTRAHAQRPHRNYVEIGVICSLQDEIIDDSGIRHQIGEFLGVLDSTKSSLSPNNVRVFRKLKHAA